MTTDRELQIFCKNIKYLRKKYDLSQKIFAQKLNISVYTLRKLERGIIPERLTCNIFFDLIDTFDLAIKDLFRPMK